MRQGNSLSLKRGRKNLKRRKLAKHIRRVGAVNYHKEKFLRQFPKVADGLKMLNEVKEKENGRSNQ
jgi:hypothetical protein